MDDTREQLTERLEHLRAMRTETATWTTADRDATLAALDQEIAFVEADLHERATYEIVDSCGACGQNTYRGDPPHVCDLDDTDEYEGRCPVCMVPFADPVAVDDCPVPEQHRPRTYREHHDSDASSVVVVPAEVLAVFDHRTGEIASITVVPREGDAGYFGSGSEVVNGVPVDLPRVFWPAMERALAPRGWAQLADDPSQDPPDVYRAGPNLPIGWEG
jgi:hypothetical protein